MPAPERQVSGVPSLHKLRQIWRLVRESHANPMTGQPQLPALVGPAQTGITFIGHSSFLLQMAGRNLLIDPVFATRLVLLRRQRHPGLRIADLPPIDLVLITHAHMDHLNLPSLRAIARRNRSAAILVPTGVDDLVNKLGFSAVYTLNWWQDLTLANLTITMTPCKHWGARIFKDTHRGFGGYVISHTNSPTIYHSGDTAYFDGFREIGHRLHPDITLLPIGAYFPDSYRAVHTSPEDALRAFVETGAQQMVPMHYGTFRLGREPMDEPLKRLKAEASRLGLQNRIHIIAEGDTLQL